MSINSNGNKPEASSSHEAMSARDHFAAVAMGVLLKGAMQFDENGSERSNGEKNFASTFSNAICFGWGSSYPIGSDDPDNSYADSIAQDAYFIADAMMRERLKDRS